MPRERTEGPAPGRAQQAVLRRPGVAVLLRQTRARAEPTHRVLEQVGRVRAEQLQAVPAPPVVLAPAKQPSVDLAPAARVDRARLGARRVAALEPPRLLFAGRDRRVRVPLWVPVDSRPRGAPMVSEELAGLAQPVLQTQGALRRAPAGQAEPRGSLARQAGPGALAGSAGRVGAVSQPDRAAAAAVHRAERARQGKPAVRRRDRPRAPVSGQRPVVPVAVRPHRLRSLQPALKR